MDIQMLALILIFVFAVIALLGLGARSFTRLVELILEAISKVEVAKQEIRQGQITLLNAVENSSDSQKKDTTPTMQGDPNTRSIAPTEITKYPRP